MNNDFNGSIRRYDLLFLNRSNMFIPQDFVKFGSTRLQLFIHYPGQLIRSLSNPTFTTKFSDFDIFTPRKVFNLDITGVTLLRGRADSNDACSIDVVDDDIRIQKKIMDLLGCRPVYWRHTPISGLSFTECNSQQDLDLAYQYTKKYEDIVLLLDVEVAVLYSFFNG